MTESGFDLGGMDVKAIVANMDSDGSGAIDYTEFLAATIDKKTCLTQDVLWTAFNVFDQNGDGKITPQELKNILCATELDKRLCGDMVAQVMKEVDTSGD